MKDKVKDIFCQLGADVCGVANVEAFASAPDGFRPRDIYADCQSVIVFALAIPKGLFKVNPRIVYQQFNDISPTELDRIAYHASLQLERTLGAVAVPVPADGPYEYWNAEKLEGRGLLSMKHAAVQAGIGTLGKSTLLLNREYGARLNIGAVLTNLPLDSDEPAAPCCLPGCHICLDSCPVQAISEQGVDQKLCRNHAYGTNARGFDVVNCNQCRVKCPVAFGKG